MNRGRFAAHQDRDTDGLHQVLNGAKPLRKTTYTRPELMQRPPTMVKPPRLTRQMTMLSRSPERKSATTSMATGMATPNPFERATATRCNNNFLPRVATLSNNNNSHNRNSNTHNVVPQASISRTKSMLQKPFKQSAIPIHDIKVMPSPKKPVQVEQIQMNLAGMRGSTSSLNSSSSYLETCKTRIPHREAPHRLPEEQNQSFVYLCKPVKKDSKDPLYPSDEDFEDLGELGLSIDESSDTQSSDELMTDRKLLLEHEPEKDQEFEMEKENENETQTELELELDELQKQKLKTELELVCKNIPSLQREIRLLQELSEQLEVTISAGQKTPNDISQVAGDGPISQRSETNLSSDSSNCTFYTPRSNLSLYPHVNIPIVHIGWRCIEFRAIVENRVTGHLNIRSFGHIEEFRIEIKTLTELKTVDEQQIFYMPLAEDGGLQRTSFRLLRENPNVLLKQLRPLTPARPFNLLEQDAMFFHHMLKYGDPALEQQLLPRATGGAQSPPSPTSPLAAFDSASLRSVHGQCAEVNWSSADVELMLSNLEKAKLQLQSLLPPTISCTSSLVDDSLKQLHPSTTSLKHPKRSEPLHLLCSKYKPRHHPRRLRVPPAKTPNVHVSMELKPQRRLLTTCVRIVQIAVFVVLVLAISYPDIRC